jgi:dTDP-4-dehydrorhamnose 3,5-epimerase
MKFKLLNTNLEGLVKIKRTKYFDNRGYLTEVLNSNLFFNNKYKFKNSIISKSKKNVLRGFHYQKKKFICQIVTCVKGSVLDVVVDIRKESKTFGKYESAILSEKNNLSFFMEKGFAHAYLTLEDDTIVLYNTSENYIKNLDSGFIWNDDFINFNWKIKNPILSIRDKSSKSFSEEFNL